MKNLFVCLFLSILSGVSAVHGATLPSDKDTESGSYRACYDDAVDIIQRRKFYITSCLTEIGHTEKNAKELLRKLETAEGRSELLLLFEGQPLFKKIQAAINNDMRYVLNCLEQAYEADQANIEARMNIAGRLWQVVEKDHALVDKVINFLKDLALKKVSTRDESILMLEVAIGFKYCAKALTRGVAKKNLKEYLEKLFINHRPQVEGALFWMVAGYLSVVVGAVEALDKGEKNDSLRGAMEKLFSQHELYIQKIRGE